MPRNPIVLVHGYSDDGAFYPFTTMLIELRLNREPLPLTGKNEICWF